MVDEPIFKLVEEVDEETAQQLESLYPAAASEEYYEEEEEE